MKNSKTITKLRSVVVLCALFGAGSFESMTASATTSASSAIISNQNLLDAAQNWRENYDFFDITGSLMRSPLYPLILQQNNITELPIDVVKKIRNNQYARWTNLPKFNEEMFNQWLKEVNSKIADYKDANAATTAAVVSAQSATDLMHKFNKGTSTAQENAQILKFAQDSVKKSLAEYDPSVKPIASAATPSTDPLANLIQSQLVKTIFDKITNQNSNFSTRTFDALFNPIASDALGMDEDAITAKIKSDSAFKQAYNGIYMNAMGTTDIWAREPYGTKAIDPVKFNAWLEQTTNNIQKNLKPFFMLG